MTVTVVVANVFEFNHREMSNARELWAERAYTAHISAEAAPYWGLPRAEGALVVISPRPIPAPLVGRYAELGASGTYLAPTAPAPTLCDAAARDPVIRERLQGIVRGKVVTIIPWGPTRELNEFARALLAWGASSVAVDGLSAERYDLGNYLEGKIGGREALRLASASGAFSLASGILAPTADLAASLGRSLLAGAMRSGLFVRMARGWGGRQVCFARSERELLDFLASRERLEFTGALLEEYVGRHGENDTPSVDCHVGDAGACVWPEIMTTSNFQCTGIISGIGALDPEWAERLRIATLAVVDVLVGLGVRGWFDVDYVRHGGRLWATETNLRRTGGTAPICFARQVAGGDWMSSRSVRSCERVELRSRKSVGDLLETYQDVEEQSSCMVAPLFTSGCDLRVGVPYVGVMLLGSSAEHTESALRLLCDQIDGHIP